MSPMLPRSPTVELALLGFLQPDPLHGYQLYQQLHNPTGLGKVWYLKQARLYALLNRLEENGYLSSSVQPQETRPARRVFRLTDSGRDAFARWLGSPVARPRQMRQEFQAKLYFARQQGAESFRRLIELQRQACLQWLAIPQNALKEAGSGDGFTFLVNQYRIKQIQAMLDWLDLCQENLPGAV